MAFDPNKFLSDSSKLPDFDPDAFLASAEKMPDVVQELPPGFVPARGGGYVRPGKKRPETAPPPDTFLQKLGRGLRSAEPAFHRFAEGLEGRGEAFGRNVNDVLTFGGWSAGTDLAGATTEGGRRASDTRYPGTATAGKVGGGLLSAAVGPAALTQRASMGLVQKLANPSGALRLAPAVSEARQLGAAGALTGFALDKAEGGDGTVGTLMGGAGGMLPAAASRGMSSLANRIKSPWQRAWTHAKETGRAGGILDEVRAGDLQRGPKGIAFAGRKARDEILTRDQELTDAAMSAYQGRVTPYLEQPGNMSPVRKQILETGVESRPISSQANLPPFDPRTGLPLEPMTETGLPIEGFVTPATKTVSKLKSVMEDLGDRPMNRDMLQVRRRLDVDADFGNQSPSPEAKVAREVRGAVRQGIREASPEIAAADDALSAFKRQQERRNDILFGREEGGRLVDAPPMSDEALEAATVTPLKLRVGDAQTVATRLARFGDDSVEGAKWQPYLDELAEQDPQFARSLGDLEARKAWLGTRFGLPEMPTNLSAAVQWAVKGAKENARLLAVPALEGASRASRGAAKMTPRFLYNLGVGARGERDDGGRR